MRLVLAVLALAAAAIPVEGARAQSWATRAPLQEPRQEVAVAELDGEVYVIGGLRADLSTADSVEVYDPMMDEWRFAAPVPTPLHHAAAAAVGGRLYVIGGHSGLTFTPLATVFEYNPLLDDWLSKAPMSNARGALAVAVIDGKIYAAGGSPAARENDFAVYDPVADRWDDLPAMPTPRNHLAAGALLGRFYAVGGRSGGIGGITDILEVFDPTLGQWMDAAPMLTARGGIAAAVVDDLLIVFGGEGNPQHEDGVFEETEAYDPGADRWESLPPMPTPRHGIGAAVVEDAVHVPGGGAVQGFGVTAVHEVFFVPEPARIALELSGFLLFALYARSRRG